MTLRPDASAVPTEQRPRAGRTLVAFWVFVVLVVAAMAGWLQLLGPPPTTAGTTAPVATTSQPRAPAVSATPEPPSAANAAAAPDAPAAPEGPAQSSAPTPPSR